MLGDSCFASRKAVPPRKPVSSSMEQRLVGGDSWENPAEGFVFHRDAAHQREDRLLVWHCRPHARDTAEVPVEPLDTVCGVYHSLYLRCIVEVCHVSLVAGIVPHTLEGTVILAPPVA